MNFLHKKSDAPRLIKAFCEKVNTRTQRYSRSFRTDQGGEYVNGDLEAYFEEEGITYQQRATYSHQSIGVAERYNQTLSVMVCPALKHAPRSLWAEANNWACYIKNRLPHSGLNGITPFEALYHAKPYISHLRPFYTKCHAHIVEEKRQSGSKLEPRSVEARLVGYTDSGKMCGIYFSRKHRVDTVRQVRLERSSHTSVDVQTPPLPSDLADTATTIMQDVRFETPPPTTHTTTCSTEQTLPGSSPETPVQSLHPPLIEVPSATSNIQEYLEVSDDNLESEWDSVPNNPIPSLSTTAWNTSTSTTSAPKSSKTARVDEVPETPKLAYKSYPKKDRQHTQRYCEHGFASLVLEPTTYKQAMASLDADSCQSAIVEEYQSIQAAGTRTVHDMSDLAAGRQPVGRMWVFKLKHHADGSIEWYKARIVAQGYSQISGLDNDETFAPVRRYDSRRLIIDLPTHCGLDSDQLDIKSPFLNADRVEEI